MQGISMRRAVPWAGVGLALVLAGVLAGVLATDTRSQAPDQPIIVNGGARFWVAEDEARLLAPTISKRIKISNTTTASNSFAITYEREGFRPARLGVCSGTLNAGQTRICDVQYRQSSSSHSYSGGYFQVRASQAVVVGGHNWAPAPRWEFEGGRTRTTREGIVEQIPYIWQQGCPPKAGSGCPGDPRVRPGTTTIG
jgi:hypothetical protein